MRVVDPAAFSAALLAAGLSQVELARRVRLSQAYISYVRRGQRRIDDAEANFIATVLGVPVGELFVAAPDQSRKARVS